jgi:hypothetical protein
VTNRQKCEAVVIAVMAVTIAMAGAAGARALSVSGLAAAGGSRFVWYLRFRTFDIGTEVLALGVAAYAMPRARVTSIAGRVAAVLAIFGVVAELGEWSLESSSRFPSLEGGRLPAGVLHLSELFAFAAVIAMWFFAEHRGTSPEVVAPDLS